MDYQVLQWKDDYATGNDGIDYQHKTLLNIINDLIGSFNSSNGEPNNLLIEVPVDELFKFSAHHFASEEVLMNNANFAKLKEHHEMHIQFVLKLMHLKIRLDKDENITKELIDHLLSWLENHIQVEDKEAMQACR